MPLSRESAASIGAQLRKGRLARGWTVRRLMEESGAYLDHTYYSKVESGRHTVAVSALRRVTGALNLDLDRLLAEADCKLEDYRSAKFEKQPSLADDAVDLIAGMAADRRQPGPAISPDTPFRGVAEVLDGARQAEADHDWERLASFLRVALQLTPLDDPRRASFLARLANALAWRQAFDEATEAAIEAAELLAATEGDESAARFLGEIVETLTDAGGKAAAWTLAPIGLRHAGDSRGLARVRLLMVELERVEADQPHNPGMMLASADRLLLHAARDALSPEDKGQLSETGWGFGPHLTRDIILRNHSHHATVLPYFAGEFRMSVDLWRQRVRSAAFQHKVNLEALANAHLASSYTALGDFAAAQAAFRRGLELGLRLASSSDAMATLAMVLYQLRFALDEGWDELENAVEGYLAGLGGTTNWVGAMTRAAAAHVYAQVGRGDEALSLVEGAMPAIEHAPGWAPFYNLLVCTAGEVLWLLDQRNDLAASVERNVREKVLTPDLRCPMRDSRRTIAQMRALNGAPDEASEWFSMARMVLKEQGALPLLAITDYDEALMHVRAGTNYGVARSLLERAHQQFVALGMDGWVVRADDLAATL